MRSFARFVWFFALFAAAAAPTISEARRDKVALVLSGGGAAGVAHVGVIKELERMGIRPDIITGTSMGAVVGGLYASGFTPDDLERAVTEVDWTRILDDASERDLIHPLRRDQRLDPLSIATDLPVGLDAGGPKVSAGLVDGVKLTLILRQLTAHVADIDDFDALPIPFRAVATDLLSAQEVVLGDGDLSDAMRASMSIPGLFPPVKRDGKVLVDGGVTNNLPIDVARQLGADIVIAAFVPPARASEEDVATFTGALGQSMAIFIHARSRAQIAELTQNDVLLTLGVEDVGMLDFEVAPETIDKGVEAVQEKSAEFARLFSGRAPAEPWANIGDTANNSLSYDRIVIEYDGVLSHEVIRRRLDLPESGSATAKEIEIAARRVYGLDLFENVTYRFERRDGERVLVFKVERKNLGFLQPRLGLALSNTFGGDSDFTLAAGVTFAELNSLGGRLELDFALGEAEAIIISGEQPLDYDLRFFALGRTGYITQTGTLYGAVDQPVAEVQVETFVARGAFTWSPGDWGGFGPFVDYENAAVTTDYPAASAGRLDESRTDRLLAGLILDYDTLDDVDLPTSGVQIGAEIGFDVLDGDGGGAVKLDGLAAASWDRHTISPYIFAEGDFDNEGLGANFIGGLLKLPGFDDNELVGDVVAASGFRYYYRSDLIPYFGTDAFVGGSVAYGGAFEDWSGVGEFEDGFLAGSVFVGVETLFGPALIGFGAADEGQFSGALTLGQRF